MKYEIIKHGPSDEHPYTDSQGTPDVFDHEVTGAGETEDDAFTEAYLDIRSAYPDDFASSGLAKALDRDAESMSVSVDEYGRDFYVTIRFSLIQDVK